MESECQLFFYRPEMTLQPIEKNEDKTIQQEINHMISMR